MEAHPIPKAHNLIASDRVEGTLLRRANGEMIGKIERLMIDKESGNVAYAVLGCGGFLRFGRKHLAIPWERLHYNSTLGAYQLAASDEALDHPLQWTPGDELDLGERSDAAFHQRRLHLGPE